MKFLIDRGEEDSLLLRKICLDTLCLDLIEKKQSDLFCGFYIEGRNREINTVEDESAFRSFKIFSECNYPYFILSPNGDNIFNNNPEYKNSRIHHVRIPELNSHDSYSQFMIKHCWEFIPKEFNNILFFHPDGFLIKEGWEHFVLDNRIDYIGGAWCHTPRIEAFHEGQWKLINLPAIQCGNGGFSFRRRSACEEISKNFSNLIMREYGRDDNRPPPEDLFYSHLINGTIKGSRVANLQQCMKFSLDPITKDEYNRKRSFGFHSPKKVNEFQNYRDYFLSL
jgi:hypothetical protein